MQKRASRFEAQFAVGVLCWAVRRALQFESNEPVPLYYSGGVFKAGTLMLDPLRHHLERQLGTTYQLKSPVLPLSIRTAIYAASISGQPISGRAMQRLVAAHGANREYRE